MDLNHLSQKRGRDIPECEVFEFFKKTSNYCVCVPVINEGKRFQEFLKKLKIFSSLVDILILDGGSTDGSTDINILKSNRVRTLIVKRGPGKLGAQLRMGYAYALVERYRGVITIDGNGKDDPKAISIFVKHLEKGYDYLQGSRFIKGGIDKNTPLGRYLAIRLIHAPLLSLVSGFRYTDTTPGFRGYSRKLLLEPRLNLFRSIFNTYELLAYITARAPRFGFKTKEIAIRRSYPSEGEIPTKITGVRGHFKLFWILIKTIFGAFNP